MNGRSSILPIILALSVFPFAGCRTPQELSPAANAFQAGAAELDITPPVGYRMAGYFNERISTGVHDPLYAKAIVLQQGRKRVALVFSDLVGVSRDITSKARRRASEQTGIPPENIVICATHTHTGPLYDGALRNYFHKAALEKSATDPHETTDYPAFLVEQWVNVIAAAEAQVRPAQLAVGVAKQEGLSFNRRFWMKDGKVVFNPGRLNPDIVQPAGPIDPDVGILLARRLEATEPFAGMTVFAVHSDTVGGTLYSADYEYFLEGTLRRAFGTGFISAFGIGTCGDLNHINVKEQDSMKGFERAEHIGAILGQTVVDAAKTLPDITKPALAARSTTLNVPLQEVTPEQVADAHTTVDKLGDTNVTFLAKVAAVRVLDLASQGPICPIEVQVFRLDADSAIVCLPGEIFVELGLAIKQASPFKTTIVMEICNDSPSYVPTLKAFEEGSYEVTNSRVKPGAGEMLVDAAVNLLKELKE
jgi:hypothetical protein